jgi:hypothetical protein
MWAKGSQINQVANPRGTNKNFVFCKDQLLPALGKNREKIKALYSFVITCLPHIEVTKTLESAKMSNHQDYIKMMEDHADMHIIIWFCVQLEFEFAEEFKAWAEKTAENLNIKVSAGHFRPEGSLKKLANTIMEMPAWRRAGVDEDYLRRIAEETKKLVSYRLAQFFQQGLKV